MQTSELIKRLRYERDDGARDEAADAIESLLAEKERLKHNLTTLRAQLAKLIAERDALKEDAERYRYLRDDGDGVDILVLEEDEHGASWVHGYPPEELDAAIDAAMQPNKRE